MGIANENSDFPIIMVDALGEGWDDLQKLCRPYLRVHEVKRLRDILGTHCRSIIVEKKYKCKDYSDTYTNYYSKKFADYPRTCARLLFFSESIDPDFWDEVERYEGAFMGYCVVRPTRIRSLGRTILKPEFCDGVDGYMCLADYEVSLLGRTLKIRGFPHIGQDGDVTICAHAACWMSFRYFSQTSHLYKETYPYQITQLTTDLGQGRLTPSTGLVVEQVVEIFARFGLFPVVYSKESYSHDPKLFQRLLYYYVESGLPPVVIFRDHAIVAFGHTSDFKARRQAKPKGRGHTPTLGSSSEYVTSFIVNDDNIMPYAKMPVSRKKVKGYIYHDYKLSEVITLVVPLPEKVHVPAEEIEYLTGQLLRHPVIGLAAKSKSLSLDGVVLRICLVASEEYKRYRVLHPLPYQLNKIYLTTRMPRYIWLAELSNRVDIRSCKAVGEIIWDATGVREEPFPWLFVHYPDAFMYNDRDAGIIPVPELHLPGAEPYDMFESNLNPVGPGEKGEEYIEL